MTKPIRIEQTTELLTPAQKQFNTLLKKIKTAKKTLADWQEVPLVQQQKSAVITPLFDELHEHQAAMARALDALYSNKLFKKRECEKIAYLICDLAMQLIEVEGYEDFKALYNQYSEIDFDSEKADMQAASTELMKSMLEMQFGKTIEEELNTPEKVAEFITSMMREEALKIKQGKQTTKQSAKQLAQAEKAQAEEINVSKSIQAVYRQLVGALHPDREQDPVERERKTELMQRITVAYKKKDLLQLLELQMSVEQIDQKSINLIADDRLKHFNKVLKDQLVEIEMEVHDMKVRYGQHLHDMPSFASVTPKRVIASFDVDIKEVRQTIAAIKQDSRVFIDPRKTKAWLKEYDIPSGSDMFGDFF